MELSRNFLNFWIASFKADCLIKHAERLMLTILIFSFALFTEMDNLGVEKSALNSVHLQMIVNQCVRTPVLAGHCPSTFRCDSFFGVRTASKENHQHILCSIGSLVSPLNQTANPLHSVVKLCRAQPVSSYWSQVYLSGDSFKGWTLMMEAGVMITLF